eukprot:2544365-Rhodomonas_salina.2
MYDVSTRRFLGDTRRHIGSATDLRYRVARRIDLLVAPYPMSVPDIPCPARRQVAWYTLSVPRILYCAYGDSGLYSTCRTAVIALDSDAW